MIQPVRTVAEPLARQEQIAGARTARDCDHRWRSWMNPRACRCWSTRPPGACGRRTSWPTPSTWSPSEWRRTGASWCSACVTGRRRRSSAIWARLRAGHPVALLDVDAPGRADRRADRSLPAGLRGASGRSRAPRGRTAGPMPAASQIAAELAVLLSTSGTTGSPKLVRLSHRNVAANASSIAQYLEIDGGERAIASLPFHYSYGLSVLHSHLVAGASVIAHAPLDHAAGVLGRRGALGRDLVRRACPTRTRSSNAPLCCARPCPTRCGRSPRPAAAWRPESMTELHELMSERGGRLWVMYGQTEATARISYVPPRRCRTRLTRSAIPIPGGRLSVRSGSEVATEPDVEGELVYHGPERDARLRHGARGSGAAATPRAESCARETSAASTPTASSGSPAGPSGSRRSSACGQNLDEIEAAASAYGPVAAVDGGDQIVLWREADAEIEPATICGERSRAGSA